jgi:hypothetical protein
MTANKRPPWKRPNPKSKAGTSTKLTPAQKRTAKATALKHGRPYPNLVDNMAMAKAAARSKRPAKPRARSKST